MPSYNTPDPSGELSQVSHATVVLIDPTTGLPSSANGSTAVPGLLTNDQLRASPIAVTLSSDSVTINGPITVSNEVEIKNDSGNPIPVSGPLTEDQLRATELPVIGPLTDAELRATELPVIGPLTEDQLRAGPIAVAIRPAYGQEVPFLAGDSCSTSFYSSSATAIGVCVRGNWDAAVITAQVCLEYSGTEWFDVVDENGVEKVFNFAPGQISIWPDKPIHGLLMRFRSGTSANPVVQSELCTLVILMV